jgi:carboxyl-terminal processing protease
VFAGGVVTGVVGARAAGSAPEPVPGVLEEAADRISAGAARPVAREVLDRAAVEGMLHAVGDEWSTYYDASELPAREASLAGRYSGVGVWLRQDAAGVVVGSVRLGSPAGLAGVNPGDLLVRVDGQPVADVGTAAALLRGQPVREAVEVTVRGEGGERSLRLVPERLAASALDVERLPGDVLHVGVPEFVRGTGRELRAALHQAGAPPAAGVVLDLRGNPGGLLTEAVEAASAFLDGGPVVIYERRGSGLRTLDALGAGDTRTPVVVLVDGQTASAAEVVAGALQDRGRAVVVGSPTFGKGSVQEPARLSDGSAIELTVGRYLTPAGRSLEAVGVAPDVLVGAGEAPEVAARRAREVLVGLVAAAEPAGRG